MKNNNRHEFSYIIKRDLAERVAYMCSNPYCRSLTIKPNGYNYKSVKSGKACHIYSAAPTGPRSKPDKSPNFIKSFENGIWLCDKCSREVDDNESKYTDIELIKWKKDAEIYVDSLVTQDTRLRQLRMICQNSLSSLRILSALPNGLDQTFENLYGNDIGITRHFIELELVLFDNSFKKEADLINSIVYDLENVVIPFVKLNKGKQVDISTWKNCAVETLMINILQYNTESLERYYVKEGEMVENALMPLRLKQEIPKKIDMNRCKL